MITSFICLFCLVAHRISSSFIMRTLSINGSEHPLRCTMRRKDK